MRDMQDVGSETADRLNNAANWDQIRRDSKRRWNKLTDQDVAKIKNNVNELMDTLQERYGISREQAQQEVERFMGSYDRKVYEMAQGLPTGLRESMERHPWAAIATALGLGLLFGFMVKPSSRYVRYDRTHLPS